MSEELDEYNRRHPVRRNPGSEEPKKPGFGARLKGKATALEAKRQEGKQKREEERESTRRAYEAGRRKGVAKGAYQRGFQEGKRAGSRPPSHFGALGEVAGFIAAHPMDVGETEKRMNSSLFEAGSSGGGPPIIGEFGGKRRKGKRDEFSVWG